MLRLASALFLGLASTANAQEEDSNTYYYTRQECAPVIIMLDELAKWNETPLFIGEGLSFGLDGTPYYGGSMFFVNQDTGSWSLLTMYADGTACFSAIGTEFEPYSQ